MQKLTHLYRSSAVILFLLIVQIVSSQVTTTLNIIPPFSPYYRDYAGYSNNKAIITLIYTGGATNGNAMNVFISGSMTKDDGSVSISVRDEYRPNVPITLMPNIPKTITGGQLRDIFGNGTTNDLVVTGLTKEEIIQNQALPEGNYDICVKVRDYQTGALISQDCRSMFIVHSEPPQIIPYINDEVTALNPQYVNVIWSPATPFVQGIKYTLKIAKLSYDITPNEAIEDNTKIIMEKSGLSLTNFPLDLASGIKLDTGSVYVMQVRATAPTAYIKNDGKSEPVVFKYVGQKLPVNLNNPTANFKFLNPRDLNKPDTLKVNNDKDLVLNWGWIKEIKKDSSILDDAEQIKLLNLQKYNLTIKKKSNQNVILQKTFEKDASDKIKNFLQLSQDETKKAGFADGDKYLVVIDALDNTDKVYKTFTSNDFIYKTLGNEEETVDVKINGKINYEFKNFVETYPVNNTAIVIDALKKTSNRIINKANTNILIKEIIKNVSYDKISSQTTVTDSLGGVNGVVNIPKHYLDNDTIYFRIKIGNKYYVDKDFKLAVLPPVISTVLKDSLGNATDSVVQRKDNSLNFGLYTAKTYAYKLKLNVQKKFTSYTLTKDENGLNVSLSDGKSSQALNNYGTNNTQVFDVNDSIPEAGIPVVLYREDKQDYIPEFEGDVKQTDNKVINSDNKKITVVAVGTTQMVNKKSYAIFERLLATDYQNEEYKILAIKNLDEYLNKGKQTAGNANNVKTVNNVTINNNSNNSNNSGGSNYSVSDFSLIGKAILDITNFTGGFNTNFVDSSSFVAEVMPYKLSLPSPNAGDAAYYRTVEANYDIVSCKPPTSIIKGKLSYAWASNKSMKRPLANTHFRVIVDYVDGSNKHVGKRSTFIPKGIAGTSSVTSFQFDNSDDGFLLLDQDATMAEGTTDAEGNFQIEAVNINKKGTLGAGTLTTTTSGQKGEVAGKTPEDELKEKLSGEDVINPWDQNNFNSMFGNENNAGIQGSFNSGFNVGFDGATGAFELGQGSFGGKNGAGGFQGAAVHQRFDEEFNHGPNPSNSPEPSSSNDGSKSNTTSTHYTNFKRVFRIVVDGDAAEYYYPSKDVVELQPFQNSSTPQDITNFVREFQLNTYTKELNSDKKPIPLSDMQVTIFRVPENKPKHLPQGEGDGKYLFKELINPEYSGDNALSKTYRIDADNIFSKKFELLWSATPLNFSGFASTNKLVQALRGDYFIEASSFVDKTSKTYQATIAEIPDSIFDIESVDWTNPPALIVNANVTLSPLTSRALITVRDVVSGKPLTSDYSARAIYSKKSTPQNIFSNPLDYPFKQVDKYGKAEILATQYPMVNWLVNDPNPTNIFFYCSANGYKTSTDQYKATFVKKGYQSNFDIGLTPAGKIKGKIITPSNKSNSIVAFYPVKVYLQADSGKVFENNDDGTFEINVPIVKNAKLKIIPKDVAYFDSTYVISEADSKLSTLDLNNIQIPRRKHRIQFYVTQKQDPNFVGPAAPVNGAIIQLGDDAKTTAANGGAKFEFENVSVNNYTFVVKGANGSGYIPKTVNIHSEETKDFVVKKIELEKGSEISGVVKLDNVPVKNARVYIDVSNVIQNIGTNGQMNAITNLSLGNSFDNNTKQVNSTPTGEISQDANLVVAYTDKFGKYTLKGVPVNNQKINIHATLDTTFTVSGDLQQADIKSGKAVTNLNLAAFNQAIINKVYGFPLTVEKITPVNGNSNQVKVTGLVHWTEAVSDFKLKEVAKSVRIEETLFDIVNKNGNKVGVVNGNEVKLTGISNLKLSYLDKYNVQLVNADGISIFNTKPLKIVKSDDFGKISGKIRIVDNSFNYPSSYLSFDKSEFYLAKVNNSVVNNIVDVATSAYSETEAVNKQYNNISQYSQAVQNFINSHQSNVTYYLCDKDAKPIEFKLIRFDAKANPLKSFIDNTGKIHLNADLKCHIANSQPEDFELNIPEIVLDENKVNPVNGSEPIKLKLEDWTLEVKNWSFSVEEGGIVSNNSKIRTNVLDIPVNKFVLRKDMFLMSDFQLGNLTLAGGKFTLTGVNPAKANLNYEYKVGSDMKPHWNFCLLSNGNDKVASLAGIEGLYKENLTEKYSLDFNYIQILSNNEMLVQLKQQDKKARLVGNKLASFEPLSIYNGPDYISLNGLLNVGAPRMSDIVLTSKWSSPTVNPVFETVSTDFEGKGFVHFIAEKKDISITKDLITIQGKVMEKPSKTFNAIPSTFYARSNASPTYEVMMQKDWVTQLTDDEPNDINSPVQANNGGYKLKIDHGGMKVVSGDWSTCKFTGLMQKNTNLAKPDQTDNIKDSNTSFEVLGDITASSDNVTMSGIDTPFGSFTQVFDFANKQLIGTLKINEFALGSFTLHSGTIETCVGIPGFYVAGGCYAYIPAGILAGDYNLGFMAGTYPLHTEQGQKLWNVTNTYIDPSVQNTCYYNSTDRLSGMYAAFNREIINIDISQDYVIASGYVRALALIGGDMYVNVSKGWKIGFDGYIHIDVGAGLSAITGTSISGGIKGDGKIGFQVGTPSYFQASILLDFEAKLSQFIGFTTVSTDISVGCSATGGTSGFDFHLGSGGETLKCP